MELLGWSKEQQIRVMQECEVRVAIKNDGISKKNEIITSLNEEIMNLKSKIIEMDAKEDKQNKKMKEMGKFLNTLKSYSLKMKQENEGLHNKAILIIFISLINFNHKIL